MRSAAILFVGSLVGAAVPGCTTTQARKVHHAGEVVTAGGLIGMLVCGVTASAIPSHDNEILGVGLVFVPISILGALVYIATDEEATHEHHAAQVQTGRQRRQAEAWELTKQAAAAARSDDCTQVAAIDPRVRDLDREFHGQVFLGDVAISRCLRGAN